MFIEVNSDWPTCLAIIYEPYSEEKGLIASIHCLIPSKYNRKMKLILKTLWEKEKILVNCIYSLSKNPSISRTNNIK